jgi:hypothetical protein
VTAFPRLNCYAVNRGSGAPYVLPDGSLDEVLLADLARFDTVTLNLTPWFSLGDSCRTDALLQLRARDPRIRILAYSLLTHWYLPATFWPATLDHTFAADWQRAIVATKGFIPSAPVGYEVDWSKRDTADALTKLLCAAASSRLFDGFFGDFMSPTLDWVAQTPDFTPEKDKLRLANMTRLCRRLREAGGPGFLVLANGVGADRLPVDGLMREGFPVPFTTFEQARETFEESARPHDWLQAGWFSDPYSAEGMREARFALGTACLFGSALSFGPDHDLTYRYAGWWQDEWSINGRTGWLGEPRHAAGTIGRLWCRDFMDGVVLVNPGTEPTEARFNPNRYCHLTGERNPELNDGAYVTVETVPPQDARFLWRVR